MCTKHRLEASKCSQCICLISDLAYVSEHLCSAELDNLCFIDDEYLCEHMCFTATECRCFTIREHMCFTASECRCLILSELMCLINEHWTK